MPTESTGSIDQSDNLNVQGDNINLTLPQSGGSSNPVAAAVSKTQNPWAIIGLAAAVIAVIYFSRHKK